jgi:hypothetical protein
MGDKMQAHSRTLSLVSWRFWLVALALAIGGLVFAPFYLFRVIWPWLIWPWLPHSYRVVPAWLEAVTLFDFVCNLLFSHLASYLAFSLLGIEIALAALLWARPHWLVRILLALTLLAIAAFPWVYRYQPALVAAPGLAMREPTDPGWLGGVVKRAQAGAEIRPCIYSLLGWSKDGTLYYQARCEDGHVQTWATMPDRESSGRMVTSAPVELFVERAPVTVYDRVRAAGVWPTGEEPNTRRVHLREGSLLSPGGYWAALVARHVYGPEDVVIVQWQAHE